MTNYNRGVDWQRCATGIWNISNIAHIHGATSKDFASSIGSLRYALVGFLHKILNHLPGKLESFDKNSSYFLQLLKSVNPQSLHTLISFDASLFTNVSFDEALQVIS
jgi:hypothetical protein